MVSKHKPLNHNLEESGTSNPLPYNNYNSISPYENWVVARVAGSRQELGSSGGCRESTAAGSSSAANVAMEADCP